jgi:hypothetical protein
MITEAGRPHDHQPCAQIVKPQRDSPTSRLDAALPMIDIGFWLLWRPKADVDHEY